MNFDRDQWRTLARSTAGSPVERLLVDTYAAVADDYGYVRQSQTELRRLFRWSSTGGIRTTASKLHRAGLLVTLDGLAGVRLTFEKEVEE